MDNIKTFFDTSTIHGLSWISGTRRWSRLFWILIVAGGFSGAGYLIYTSFDNWEKSPISTTVETRPKASGSSSRFQGGRCKRLRTRQGQDRDEIGTRQGQDRNKTGIKQGQDKEGGGQRRVRREGVGGIGGKGGLLD